MKRVLEKLVYIVVFLICALNCYSQTAKIDSRSALIPQLDGKELVEVYIDLSKEYQYLDPSKVIEYGKIALDIASENRDRPGETKAHLIIGAGYMLSGNFEEGRINTEKGRELAEEIGDQQLIMQGQITMASYYMNHGRYPKALELYHEALAKAVELKLDDKIAIIQLNIGSVLTAKGDRVSGLRYLLNALEYYRKKEDSNIEARILNNIAVNYHSWKDYDRALEYYLETYELNKRLNDFVGQAIVLNNIGEIYKDKGVYEKAISYYNQVIQISDSIQSGDFDRAYAWLGLGEVYMLKDDFENSDRYLDLALSTFVEVKMQDGIANTKYVLSQVSLEKNHLEQALKQINETRDLAKECGVIDLEQQSCQLKAQILNRLGRYKEAYACMEEYSNISDSLYNRERMSNFAQVRSEMDFAQKQKEVELLQKDNQIKDLEIKKHKYSTLILSLGIVSLILISLVMLYFISERKKANDLLTFKNRKIGLQHQELLKVNETKDKFMSIIGHDLRNPIGAFKDVIGQLADFPDMFPEELRQQIINELRDEAESTYFLLDNLLSWAKNQKDTISFKPERLDLSSLVKSNILLNSRFAESKKIKVITKLEGELLAYADFNMVNLIFRNLLSNAIKFTGSGGSINVTANEQNDFLMISVQDTGVGISPDDLSKIFNPNDHVSTYGTNHEKGSGLGLLLCKEFVDANGGTISVDSVQGEGSTFSFTLKRYKDTI
ncbi:tetratricopeptide repeat protein [Mangrovibacterium sp.]|uniref:ATP-binding protein n=1 Tax=Mangrovibacterium sp. TaxID=1961364 RepID=UPI003563C5FC